MNISTNLTNNKFMKFHACNCLERKVVHTYRNSSVPVGLTSEYSLKPAVIVRSRYMSLLEYDLLHRLHLKPDL